MAAKRSLPLEARNLMPAPPKNNKTVVLNQRIEPELFELLKMMAQRLEIKHSALIRQILWDSVDEFDAKNASNCKITSAS